MSTDVLEDTKPDKTISRPSGMVDDARLTGLATGSREGFTGLARSGPHYVWVALRLALGWIFAWAFLDKTFGLGVGTESTNAWVDGGSPTEGFLTFGTSGPFAETFQSLALHGWADWLFMIGLAGIGGALVLGIGIRLAAASGATMLVLMWLAALWPANNPFMDDHLIYALVLIGIACADAGDTLGLGRWWKRQPIVRRLPILI